MSIARSSAVRRGIVCSAHRAHGLPMNARLSRPAVAAVAYTQFHIAPQGLRSTSSVRVEPANPFDRRNLAVSVGYIDGEFNLKRCSRIAWLFIHASCTHFGPRKRIWLKYFCLFFWVYGVPYYITFKKRHLPQWFIPNICNCCRTFRTNLGP